MLRTSYYGTQKKSVCWCGKKRSGYWSEDRLAFLANGSCKRAVKTVLAATVKVHLYFSISLPTNDGWNCQVRTRGMGPVKATCHASNIFEHINDTFWKQDTVIWAMRPVIWKRGATPRITSEGLSFIQCQYLPT